MYLRQSTIQAVMFGPFVDSTDGVTPETALTIAQADRQLSKDGAVHAQSSETGNATHDIDGFYYDNLTATDTATCGVLKLNVTVAGALPVWETFFVVEEAVYDAMYAASAAGPLQSTTAARKLDVTAGGCTGIDWNNIEAPTTSVDLSGTDIQLCDTVTDNTDLVTAVAVRTEVDSNSTQLAAIILDTAEIGTAGVGLTDLGGMSTGMKAEVNTECDTAVAALNDIAAGDVWAVDATSQQTAGTFGQAIGDPAANTETMYDAIVTDAAGTNVAVDIIAIKTETAEIVTDTAELGAAVGADLSADIADIKTDTAAIVLDTAEIGTAGAGLTDLGGMSTGMKAEIQTESDASLVTIGLDHMLSTSVTGTDVADNSIVASLVSKEATADWDDYDNTTESNQAIRDRGDASWVTGAGGSPPDLLQTTTITVTTQTEGVLAAGSADDDAYLNQLGIIVDSVTAEQKSVVEISDYVGSSKTISFEAAPKFTMATGDTIHIVAKTNHVTLADTVTTLTGHTVQTGDSYARLGAPAGASVSADLAEIEGQTDDIGVNGAGLTDLGGMSTGMKAEVNAECDTAVAALNDITAQEVWEYVVENSLTAEELLRLILAGTAGALTISGAITSHKNNANDKTRITMTNDTAGVRSNPTYDAT